MPQNSFHGAHYLGQGFKMLTQKGIKRFVFIPLAINLTLLSIALIYVISKVSDWTVAINAWLASFDTFEWIMTAISWLIWPLVIIGVLLFVFFFFAILANWIAAPFNGLLAEAVENKLSGKKTVPEQSYREMLKDVPRLLKREWTKLKYYIPRALVCLLLLLVPLIGALLFPIIWFAFNSWMMSVQYLDYPMDNHKIPFEQMLAKLRQSRSGSLGFGAMVMLMTMLPIINLLVMPAAVCGATKLWFDHLKDKKHDSEPVSS
ncbi:sulfate transporter CysZ [Kangiella sp. TOML190]|uniref:sulfate transporter CysZ n=1 Tax=Kangiella sp. TOML190 TaxID=2931351 RepID=UPI002040EFDD|nr:sulfate transporter CysZ [Kangiella sp. TOML190]